MPEDVPPAGPSHPPGPTRPLDSPKLPSHPSVDPWPFDPLPPNPWSVDPWPVDPWLTTHPLLKPVFTFKPPKPKPLAEPEPLPEREPFEEPEPLAEGEPSAQPEPTSLPAGLPSHPPYETSYNVRAGK